MNSNCITSNTTIGLEGGEFMLHPDAMKILEWFSINHKNFDLLSNCLNRRSYMKLLKNFLPDIYTSPLTALPKHISI